MLGGDATAGHTTTAIALVAKDHTMPSTTELRDALQQIFDENRTLIADLSPSDMARPTANPRWKVRQLAAHIAEDDGGTLYVAKILAKGKNAKAPTFVVNLANWWSLRKYSKAQPADLLAVMDKKHHELAQWLDALPEEALQRGGEVSGMGHVTTSGFLIENCKHSQEHAAELRAALARP